MLISGPRTGVDVTVAVFAGEDVAVADGTSVDDGVALAEAVAELVAVPVALGNGVCVATDVAVDVGTGVTVASITMIVPVMPDDALDRYAYVPASWKSSTKLAPGRIGPELHRPDTASTLWMVTELVLVQRTVSPR